MGLDVTTLYNSFYTISSDNSTSYRRWSKSSIKYLYPSDMYLLIKFPFSALITNSVQFLIKNIMYHEIILVYRAIPRLRHMEFGRASFFPILLNLWCQSVITAAYKMCSIALSPGAKYRTDYDRPAHSDYYTFSCKINNLDGVTRINRLRKR